ncbi:MAG TPA: hypothetical protein VGN97_04030 [Mesorhizobium sp.]|jgi:hypothetical protein|nr:hypothetical protein [Mesorhizobium sp.]
MKKMILASLSAVAFLSVAACSDTDETTTNSVGAPSNAPVTSDGTGGATASGGTGGASGGDVNATAGDGPVNETADNSFTQETVETGTDRPESGTGGVNQTITDSDNLATQPPASGATAQ